MGVNIFTPQGAYVESGITMNAITLYVESDDPGVKAHREEVAGRVARYFEQRFTLPTTIRSLVYLSNWDVPWLKERFGGCSNKGIHTPFRNQDLLAWPTNMWETIAPIDPLSWAHTSPYDSVIYLHRSTCETDIGLTMTLAHELQHFMQYANERRLWVANTLLMNLPSHLRDDLRVWSDFPAEREARIIAKRVVEELYEKEAVREYIRSMIRANITPADAKDWQFIEGIDPSVQYNLAEGTMPFVQRHLSELIELSKDADFQRKTRITDVDFRFD